MLNYNPIARVLKLVDNSILPAPPVNLDIETLLPMARVSAYLGDDQPYGRKTQSGRLSKHQVKILESIGIKAEAGDYVEKGLVTALTKNGPLDLEKIHNYFVAQLSLIKAFPESCFGKDVQLLMAGIQLSRRLVNSAITTNNTTFLRKLRQEQAVQYSQLGTLMLPSGLVSKMREPLSFVENTAQRLGRLVELNLL